MLCPLGPSLPGLGQAGRPECRPRASVRQAGLGAGLAGKHLCQQSSLPPSFSQLKAFKDEEKTKEALKQQKRKAKVRRFEGGSSTHLILLIQGAAV